MMEFAGRVAVVTGAAEGLGRAIAEQAAALGMKLVLADLDDDALELASAALQERGAEVLALVCDVRKGSHVEELADAAMIRFHAVHLLFNVGCGGAAGLVWEHGEANWEDGAGASLGGAVNGVRVFAPLMLACAARDAGYRGHIVNTAPLQGLAGAPGLGMDNVAAHGLLALTESLYQDLQLAGAPIGTSLLCARGRQMPTARAHHIVKGVPALTEEGRQTLRRIVDETFAGVAATPADLARAAFDGIGRGDFMLGADPQVLVALAARVKAFEEGAAPVDALALGARLQPFLQRKSS
jgi:NAD(P)-dependent dehydrogenase (short-subunit alcohol dehydrogenase family)